jgi:phosphatidylinositol alpha-1,6-mannosyltransferase
VHHLLVTNDFPPKLGGIQSYLWELWRRLPADEITVLTTPYEGAAAWDAEQPFRIERTREPVLLPHPGVVRRVRTLADEVDADVVLVDPALPLGLIGPALGRPYGLVLHGAEITVPGRLPGLRSLLGRVLRDAQVVVAAGGYPLAEAERAAGRPLPAVLVPPGVDTDRFRPLDPGARAAVRDRYDLAVDRPLVVSVSRLVPRKGMDVLIEAVARVRATTTPGLQLAIAGGGRDRERLERLAADRSVPVSFLGRVPDDDLPGLYGCADVFAMLCRNRWLGLEQEGFGIVFLEAAAAGVPQIAGRSGGAHEAVDHGRTGLVVRFPHTIDPVVAALRVLLHDPDLRAAYGRAGRERAVASFSYDGLADQLRAGLATHVGAGR